MTLSRPPATTTADRPARRLGVHCSRLGVLVACAVLVATVVLAGCDQAPVLADGASNDPPAAEVRPAKIVTVGQTRAGDRIYPGKVRAARRAPLSFRIAGPIERIAVDTGQRVARTALLARIDPRDYEVRVRDLEARLEAARAQRVQATEEYRRVRGLYEHDTASRSDLDRARAAVEVTAAQVDSTAQALEAARLALDDTKLRAPYDGLVVQRLAEAHQTVAAGQPVLLFQSLEALEVRIDVPEDEIARLAGDDPVALEVRFEALPGLVLAAHVAEHGTETDPSTQTYPVTLRLDQAETGGGGPVLPGMTASVSWAAPEAAADDDPGVAPAVPLSSVFTDASGATCVWRVDPETQTLTRVAVQTGALTDSGLEILDGVVPGDRILAAGVHLAVEGVRPMEG
jgi:RND family efflux transporter MFP subunit